MFLSTFRGCVLPNESVCRFAYFIRAYQTHEVCIYCIFVSFLMIFCPCLTCKFVYLIWAYWRYEVCIYCIFVPFLNDILSGLILCCIIFCLCFLYKFSIKSSPCSKLGLNSLATVSCTNYTDSISIPLPLCLFAPVPVDL